MMSLADLETAVRLKLPMLIVVANDEAYGAEVCVLADLGMETGLLPTTLRERIRVLEGTGFVQRVPNPRDRRSHFVEITPEGVSFLKQASAAIRAVESDISRALGSPFEDYRPLLQELRVAEQSLLAEAAPFPQEDAGTDVTFP